MKKISRIKRRKGKTRPPTIGKNCRWLDYLGGDAVCGLKININDAMAGDVKYGGREAYYKDISCNKCRNCGYEENTSSETMVSRLSRKLSLKRELNKVRNRLDALEKIIDED